MNVEQKEVLEKFISNFKNTKMYVGLIKHYDDYEIFEEHDGIFELGIIQTAFQQWTKQNAIDQRRAEFTKNINHLISGDYVLVRKSV